MQIYPYIKIPPEMTNLINMVSLLINENNIEINKGNN